MARAKRRFGTVYRDRREDGSTRGFAARWTDAEGRRLHRRGFGNQGAAEDFVLERFAEVRAAKARRRGETPDSRLPLRELAPRILEAWQSRVRKVTHKGHVIMLRQWATVLGDRPVRELDGKVVQEAVDLMLRPLGEDEVPVPGVPRGLSPASIRGLRWTLSGAFNILRRTLGVPVENPCQGRGALALPKPQQGGGRTFTEEELERFLAAERAVADSFTEGRYGTGRVVRSGRLSARGRHFLLAAAARRYCLTVLANTGLRPEELRRLRWTWVAGDLAALELRETKTHDTRVVPLTPPAAAALRALRQDLDAQGLKPGHDDLVFPIAYSMIHSMVRMAGVAAGLGHVTPYVLRRTYGTMLIRRGAQIEDVAKTMGHGQIQTTHRYTRGAGQGAVARVRDFLGHGFGGTRAASGSLAADGKAAPQAPLPAGPEGGQPGTTPEPAAPAGPAPGALPS